MKLSPTAFNTVWGPPYHPFSRYSKGGNYNSVHLNIHVTIQAKEFYWEWCWDISGVFSQVAKPKPCLCVLVVSVVTWATPRIFVVFTMVRKGKRVSLRFLCEPCVEGFKWRVLRFRSWMRGDKGPANRWSREGWGVSLIETAFGWQKTCALAHCHPGPAQGCSACYWLPIHWDMDIHRIHFLNHPSMTPEIHLPSKSTRPDHPGGVHCR